jgi:hypothetical protein
VRLADLEGGRWLEVTAVGDWETIGGVRAPWLSVHDPFAPASGPLTGPADGWVWGGLVDALTPERRASAQLPWERAIVAPDGIRSLQAVEGQRAVRVRRWDTADRALWEADLQGVERVQGAWARAGGGGTWLFVDVTLGGTPTLMLVAPNGVVHTIPLRLDPAPGASRAAAADADGDGAVELFLAEDLYRAGQLESRRLRVMSLGDDGTLRESARTEASGLLPPTDLAVASVEARPEARSLLVTATVRSDGAASPPTALLVTVVPCTESAGRGPSRVVRVDVPAMLPGEVRSLDAEVDLPAGTWAGYDVDAFVVPSGPEPDLDDNRAAR